jgi:hypothetical protein
VIINKEDLTLFEKIIERGFGIANGGETSKIVRELKRANVPIQHGYSQETKKVIVALERPVVALPKQRTLNKTMFELKLDD